jgi:hypothetical protein
MLFTDCSNISIKAFFANFIQCSIFVGKFFKVQLAIYFSSCIFESLKQIVLLG